MSGVKKKKRFILTVSETFFPNHSKGRQPTGFAQKVIDGTKKHTIRPNYELWENRFRQIERGEGDLIVNKWSERPYFSPQLNVKDFSNKDGIGIQKLEYVGNDNFIIDGKHSVQIDILAANDGLSIEDFKEWFGSFPVEPMVLIHFTPFRYGKEFKRSEK